MVAAAPTWEMTRMGGRGGNRQCDAVNDDGDRAISSSLRAGFSVPTNPDPTSLLYLAGPPSVTIHISAQRRGEQSTLSTFYHFITKYEGTTICPTLDLTSLHFNQPTTIDITRLVAPLASCQPASQPSIYPSYHFTVQATSRKLDLSFMVHETDILIPIRIIILS